MATIRASKTLYIDDAGKATDKQPAGASRVLVREGQEINESQLSRFDGAAKLLGSKGDVADSTTVKASKTLFIDADGNATDKQPEGAARILVKEGHEIDEATFSRYQGAAKLLGVKAAKDEDEKPAKGKAKH
jgi:hypothetical protein